MAGPLFPISYRKIASFNQCRKKYWYEYIARTPKDPDERLPAALVGTGVHRAMRTLCLTGRPEDGWAELDSYLRMPGHEAAGPGTCPYDDGLACFATGYEAHESIVSENRWGELPAGYQWKSGGIYVEGRIDRVDRISATEMLIVDWKTSRWDPADATDGQLDIMHALIRSAWKLPREVHATAIGWNLRTGAQRIRRLTRDDAAATMGMLAAAAQRMQDTTEFEATPSPACRICDYRLQCPDAFERTDWEAGDRPEDGDDLFDELEPAEDDLPFD